jgi:hypothetical protein
MSYSVIIWRVVLPVSIGRVLGRLSMDIGYRRRKNCIQLLLKFLIIGLLLQIIRKIIGKMIMGTNKRNNKVKVLISV